MTLKLLHDLFFAHLKGKLPEWRFVGTHRHFVKVFPGRKLYAHVAFINHVDDFDAVFDVAVEFLADKKRVCIVGASLGNIEGVGQVRYNVSSPASAETSARSAAVHLRRVGMPFFERYDSTGAVLSALRQGGEEARLISPFLHLHAEQIAALESTSHTASRGCKKVKLEP